MGVTFTADDVDDGVTANHPLESSLAATFSSLSIDERIAAGRSFVGELYAQNALIGSDVVALGSSGAVCDPAGIGSSGGMECPIPMGGTIVSNPYGEIVVTGSDRSPIIQLGSTPGTAGSFAELDFQNFALGAGTSLTLRSGAPGQTLVINVPKTAQANALRATAGEAGAARVHPQSTVGVTNVLGVLQTQGGNDAPPPELELNNPNGVSVDPSGRIEAPAGLTVSTLSNNSPNAGEDLVNNGIISGGDSLLLSAAKINGGGVFRGNAFTLSTFGNSNNPGSANFLANALTFEPASGGVVTLTINDYGGVPQFLNLKVNGDAVVSMPSAGLGGGLPLNNPPVDLGGTRPAGVAEPSYGGGSLIVQATGALTLSGGASNDFVFPGGIVLKAGTTLNVNDVFINQGWTTSGRTFQGVFLEAPNIVSPSIIRIYSNDLNWVNFSTFPKAPVRVFTLVSGPSGNASFVSADAIAPHLNTYSVLIEAAANNQCWICLVNTQPVNMLGP